MKFVSTVVSAALIVGSSAAFQGFSSSSAAYFPTNTHGSRGAQRLHAVNPQQLTDYMAKAHEEKLRAVKLAEEKKNVEIQVRLYIAYPWT